MFRVLSHAFLASVPLNHQNALLAHQTISFKMILASRVDVQLIVKLAKITRLVLNAILDTRSVVMEAVSHVKVDV